MNVCPHCDNWDERHTAATMGDVELIGCPKIREGARFFLSKSSWKDELRCIGSELNKLHLDHEKNFGTRKSPTTAYLGKEEVALLHAETNTSRYFGIGSTIEEFTRAMSRGEAGYYTPCGCLTLHAVDAPKHLALGRG